MAFRCPKILFDAVECHATTVKQYKYTHDYAPGTRINSYKIGAFTTFWLAKRRPIYDTEDEALGIDINDEFAMQVGMTQAKIDPALVRMSPAPLNFWDHLKFSLRHGTISADALVVLYMALHKSFPDPSQHAP